MLDLTPDLRIEDRVSFWRELCTLFLKKWTNG